MFMHKKSSSFGGSKSGFTLIELLVVIAIISILASVVLASLNTARQKSRDAKRISDVNQIRIALELYFDDNNGYPLALDNTTLVVPGYLPAIPLPPVGTGEAAYLYQGLGTGCVSYHLGATLENASHDSFAEDADAPANDIQAVACEGAGVTDFSGTDPVYDVKP
ncbi:MAG: type II secretion system protein [Parcubacteria group bacterium]|nr:type II secretion system protein [Parcubacteria group bacterium]